MSITHGATWDLPGVIVHSVNIPVLEHGMVIAAIPFPQFIVDDGDILSNRMMQPAARLAGRADY